MKVSTRISEPMIDYIKVAGMRSEINSLLIVEEKTDGKVHFQYNNYDGEAFTVIMKTLGTFEAYSGA